MLFRTSNILNEIFHFIQLCIFSGLCSRPPTLPTGRVFCRLIFNNFLFEYFLELNIKGFWYIGLVNLYNVNVSYFLFAHPYRESCYKYNFFSEVMALIYIVNQYTCMLIGKTTYLRYKCITDREIPVLCQI